MDLDEEAMLQAALELSMAGVRALRAAADWLLFPHLS
jgi:hypothetical protein